MTWRCSFTQRRDCFTIFRTSQADVVLFDLAVNISSLNAAEVELLVPMKPSLPVPLINEEPINSVHLKILLNVHMLMLVSSMVLNKLENPSSPQNGFKV